MSLVNFHALKLVISPLYDLVTLYKMAMAHWAIEKQRNLHLNGWHLFICYVSLQRAHSMALFFASIEYLLSLENNNPILSRKLALKRDRNSGSLCWRAKHHAYRSFYERRVPVMWMKLCGNFTKYWDVIYQTRERVFHQDIQTPRSGLKKRGAAEFFWPTSRCLDTW